MEFGIILTRCLKELINLNSKIFYFEYLLYPEYIYHLFDATIIFFTIKPLPAKEAYMRRFHSYGPVNSEHHFCVERNSIVEKCANQLLGIPEEGGHFFTI